MFSLNLKRVYILYHFILLVLLSVLFSSNYLTQINSLLLDRFHGYIEPSPEIVIVSIDDSSIDSIGPWPWNRSIFANLIQELDAANARVIGFDLLLVDPREGDDALQTTINQSQSNIVFASKLENGANVQSVFTGDSVSHGFVNLPTDLDGKVRRTQLTYQLDNQCALSWDLVIVTEFLGTKSFAPDCGEAVAINPRLTVPNTAEITYSRDQPTTVTVREVLNQEVDSSIFENKIVLVGVTANEIKTDVSDNLTDIFGNQSPGVLLHAQIINTILSGRVRQDVSYVHIFGFLVAYLSFLLWLHSRIGEIRLELATLIFNIIIFNIIGLIAFEFNYNWPFIQTTILFVIHFVLSITYRYFIIQNDKQFLEKAFSHYINPSLLHQLSLKPESMKLGGEARELSIMFTDIRNFTGISENMEPEELVSFLNKYLEKASSIVLKHNGTIDKYIGDSIMAFWNAPLDEAQHPQKALRAGLELIELVKKFNLDDDTEKLAIGIGINTGRAVVGNIGGQQRFDYTIIGDQVNLAARMESLTKQYKVGMLISDATYEACKYVEGVLFRKIDVVRVKGKKRHTTLYQPLTDTPENAKIISKYEKAFQLYEAGKFSKAKELFSSIEHDVTSKIMAHRCHELIENEVKNWNGIWNWESK